MVNKLFSFIFHQVIYSWKEVPFEGQKYWDILYTDAKTFDTTSRQDIQVNNWNFTIHSTLHVHKSFSTVSERSQLVSNGRILVLKLLTDAASEFHKKLCGGFVVFTTRSMTNNRLRMRTQLELYIYVTGCIKTKLNRTEIKWIFFLQIKDWWLFLINVWGKRKISKVCLRDEYNLLIVSTKSI